MGYLDRALRAFCFLLAVSIYQLIFSYSFIQSVDLDEVVERYVERVLFAFDENPQNTCFDHVVHAPVFPPKMYSNSNSGSSIPKRDFFLPKLFIWALMEHFNLNVRCPEHGTQLKAGQWTKVISKKSFRNPRLVYDLGGNIVMVQRLYICTYSGFHHRYFSASTDFMNCLPHAISSLFPFKVYHRSCCTKDILHLIEMLVLEGTNFLQISEIVASLNYKSYAERTKSYLSFLSSIENGSAATNNSTNKESHAFYDDLIFSYPSDKHLIHIYLQHFQELKPLYEQEMEKTDATSISCDHTFRISKHIGCFRDADGRFVKQFGFLFILLNENNEILEWRLTKSSAYSEVKDLFQKVKGREGVNVKTIFVDNCCQSRKQLQEIMGDVLVKLDLFHAVQRVTSSVPKGTEFSKKFCKEFFLVFRQDGDLGEERKLNTPEPHVITRNLNSFCERWRAILDKEEFRNIFNEIEKLRRHISNGCISGIEPGLGTAGNERIHRCLNRSLLCGTAVVGPELALAILTALFYSLNSKRKGAKHYKNLRVVPCVPVELHQSNHHQSENVNRIAFSTMPNVDVTRPTCINYAEELDNNSTESDRQDIGADDIILVADQIEHLLTERIVKEIINNSNQLYQVLHEINSNITNKSVNFFYVPFMQMFTQETLLCSTTHDDISNNQVHNLNRNLASFGFCVDPVAGDGDCAFSSVIKQLQKLPEYVSKEAILMGHLTSLGLGKSQEEDTYHLRQLFVNHVQTNEHYQLVAGVIPERFNEETELFREPGTFCGNLGDLVIRVCADVLRIPIVVITSLDAFPFTSFVPESTIVTSSLYLAYNATTSGHYDATQKLEFTPPTLPKGCTCGKNTARGGKASCLSSGRKSCPCVRKGKWCTRACICRNCCNVENTMSTTSVTTRPLSIIKCRCGQNAHKRKEEHGRISCKDGNRKSKCPCLGNGQKCTTTCQCIGCGNIHGANSQTFIRSSPVKRKRSQASYKRVKSATFLSSEGFTKTSGTWTEHESMLLSSVIKLISLTVVTPSEGNIAKLYNYVVASDLARELHGPPLPKTTTQISAKLDHYGRKQLVESARLLTE